MRTQLRPYLLGGGASTALVAAVVAAFISLATLLSEPALSPPEVPTSQVPATGHVQVDLPVPAEPRRAEPRDARREGLAATVASLPSTSVSTLAALLAPSASQPAAGAAAGDRDGRRRGGRSGGNGGRDSGAAPELVIAPPASPPGLFPTIPAPPAPAEVTVRGRRVGQLEGEGAPPGHGGSPPRRRTSTTTATPTTLSTTGTQSVADPDDGAKPNGKTPPGQGKKSG